MTASPEIPGRRPLVRGKMSGGSMWHKRCVMVFAAGVVMTAATTREPLAAPSHFICVASSASAGTGPIDATINPANNTVVSNAPFNAKIDLVIDIAAKHVCSTQLGLDLYDGHVIEHHETPKPKPKTDLPPVADPPLVNLCDGQQSTKAAPKTPINYRLHVTVTVPTSNKNIVFNYTPYYDDGSSGPTTSFTFNRYDGGLERDYDGTAKNWTCRPGKLPFGPSYP